MISSAQLDATSYSADMGYLWLWITTAVLLLCAWRMSRWPWVRNGLKPAVEWVQQPHPLLWIVAAGALLRVPRLFDSLWYDEAFTARIAGLSAAQFLPAVQGDVHPPLWYAVEWATVRLIGNSEAALRLPAFLCGLLLIVYGYRLARALKLSERTALVFAGLIAVLPAALYYSAEARGYTLLALLAFGALIGLLEDRPLWFIAHAALLPLTHNIGYVYLGLFLLAGIWQGRRSPGRVAVLLLALIPGLVWLPTMLAQSADIADGFWISALNAGTVLRPYAEMTMGSILDERVVMLVLVTAIGSTLYGAWHYRRWLATDPQGRMLLLLIAGVPLALALASWLWRPVYLTRALLPVGLGAALLWAMLLVERPVSRLIIGPAVALALVGFLNPTLGRFDMRAAVAGCRGATSAYVTSIPAAMFASYYLPGADLTVWSGAGDLNQTLERDAMRAMGLKSGRAARGACLLALDTPRTTDAERAQVARLTAARPAQVMEWWVNPFYVVRVIQL